MNPHSNASEISAQTQDILHVEQTTRLVRKKAGGAQTPECVRHTAARLVADLDPVSYTHLDVYKRQVEGFLAAVLAARAIEDERGAKQLGAGSMVL